MLIITSNGKYLVAKEFNVRKLLATNNALYGSKGEEGAYASKPIMPNVSSLPSAYLALEEDGRIYPHIWWRIWTWSWNVSICSWNFS